LETKKKQRKRSEELAIEIHAKEENEKILDELVKEKQKLLDLKMQQLRSTEGKLKKDIILEVGEFIEKRHIYESNLICTELKKRFKGYISPAAVWQVCKDRDWMNTNSNAYGHKGVNQYMIGSKFNENRAQKFASDEQEISQQDKEYVQAHEDEIKRDQRVAQLIQSLTDKTIAEQGEIIGRGHHGEDFRKKLLEESKPYMFKVAKQMITSDISTTLWDHRTLRYLSEGFCDILYEEQELRKKKEHLESV